MNVKVSQVIAAAKRKLNRAYLIVMVGPYLAYGLLASLLPRSCSCQPQISFLPVLLGYWTVVMAFGFVWMGLAFAGERKKWEQSAVAVLPFWLMLVFDTYRDGMYHRYLWPTIWGFVSVRLVIA